jgi:hypothetical protein
VEVVVTTLVVTVAEALVAPAPIVTDAGTTATELLLDSATMMPPLGAGPVRFTDAFVETPPTALAGCRLTLFSAAGIRASVIDRDTPSAVAVTVIDVAEDTVFVVIVNVFNVTPAERVIELGTVATAVLLLDRVTTCPAAGAAALSLTVAVTGLPLVTDDVNVSTEATPAANVWVPLASATSVSTIATTAPRRLIVSSPLHKKSLEKLLGGTAASW